MKALPPPPKYFPPANGLYEVAPGLRPLQEQPVFIFDDQFFQTRANKERCRAERLSKYFCLADEKPELSRRVAAFVVERLLKEWPEYFTWESQGQGGRLRCALTSEVVRFEAPGELSPGQAWQHPLDALAMQVQEDLAITQLGPAGDKLTSIHLCAANHWAAEDKIGRDFRAIHRPVAGIDKVNAAAPALMQAILQKGPYVRFAWGVATDTRLNHHPQVPAGEDESLWRGRSFDAHDPRLWMRIERQALWGFPEEKAFLFTIRTTFRDCRELEANERTALVSAIMSMTPEQREYKGLTHTRDAVVSWLKSR